MTRHIADRREPDHGGRVKHFVALDRAVAPEGSHPASRKLARRPRQESQPSRIRQFLRIERGITA